MTAQVAADLRAAAEVLKRDGWTQGAYHSDDGCHCALGAIARVISARSDRPNPDRWKPWADSSVRLRLDALALANHLGDPVFPRLAVTDWNDAPGRTADEVIAALEAAADAAEADQ